MREKTIHPCGRVRFDIYGSEQSYDLYKERFAPSCCTIEDAQNFLESWERQDEFCSFNGVRYLSRHISYITYYKFDDR